jgi:hypothetical protein
MNIELGRRWVAALRSGDYRQGRGRLKRTRNGGTKVSYCCLGVLRELHDIPKVTYDQMLSYKVFKELFPGLDQQKLAMMNDSPGSSFETIANYIEDYLSQRKEP